MSIALDTSQFEMSPLNDVAPLNMRHIVRTLDTSHFEMSPLNNVAPLNIRVMSIKSDTSHVAIVPCEPFEQSPFADS